MVPAPASSPGPAPGFVGRLALANRRLLSGGVRVTIVATLGLLGGVLAVRQPWPSLVGGQHYLSQVAPSALEMEAEVDARVLLVAGTASRPAGPGGSSEAVLPARRSALAPTGLWHLRSVRAQEAWDLLAARGRDREPVVVGVDDVLLDTGHPDVAGRVLQGLRDDAWVMGVSWLLNLGHGTGVLGVIGGRGDPGFAGVAPAARMVPFSRLRSGSDNSMAAALATFRQAGARVANFSMAAPAPDSLQQAFDEAHGAGILAVAGLPNYDTTTPHYPAGHLRVVAVSSVDASDRAVGYGWGPLLDLVAPGPDVLTPASGLRLGSVVFGRLYQPLCCNSLATAVVSGVVALVVQSDPSLTSAQVEKRLKLSARKVAGMAGDDGKPRRWHPRYGYGAVDAYNALTLDRTGPSVSIGGIDRRLDGGFRVRGAAVDDVADGGLEPARERDRHLRGVPTSNVAAVEFRLGDGPWQPAEVRPGPIPNSPSGPQGYTREFAFEVPQGALSPGAAFAVRARDTAGNRGEELRGRIDSGG